MPVQIGSRNTVPRAKPDLRRTSRSLASSLGGDVTRRSQMYFWGLRGRRNSADAVRSTERLGKIAHEPPMDARRHLFFIGG